MKKLISFPSLNFNKKEIDYDSTHRTRKTVIGLMLSIGILLIIVEAIRYEDKLLSLILITFGITFTASAIKSYISFSAGLIDRRENVKELSSILGNRLGMPCLERFNLVESSSEVGLVKTYISREEALQKGNFLSLIEDEKKEIFIVGSSLLGFLQHRDFKHLIEVIKKKIHNYVEIKFMLTHPLFADFRAAQEGRDPGEIGCEIIKSLKIIFSFAEQRIELLSVYLYHGTPTCFGILTKRSLLLNPYPYGRQSYESPCFEFKSHTPAYNLYRQAHFQTQFAGKIEKFILCQSSIANLENEIGNYSQKSLLSNHLRYQNLNLRAIHKKG